MGLKRPQPQIGSAPRWRFWNASNEKSFDTQGKERSGVLFKACPQTHLTLFVCLMEALISDAAVRTRSASAVNVGAGGPRVCR